MLFARVPKNTRQAKRIGVVQFCRVVFLRFFGFSVSGLCARACVFKCTCVVHIQAFVQC